MKRELYSGLKTGFLLGFLALIGVIPGLCPEYLLEFYLLVGLAIGAWRRRTVGESVVAGLVGSSTIGIFVALFDLALVKGIDLRQYLVAMGSENIRLLSFSQPPLAAFLYYVGIGTALVVIGNSLGRLLRPRMPKNFRLRPRPQLSAWLTNPTVRRWLVTGFAVLVLLIPTQLSSFWNYNLGTVGIYVLLGLGLNIVVGMAGLLDLGYVAFFAIGAYTMALLTAPLPHALGWGFWSALPIGVALAALAGIALGFPVLRLRGDYLAIVTLGFGEIIRILSKSDTLTAFTGGPRGVRDVAGPTFFGYAFDSELQFLYLIIAACLLIVWITSRLHSSRVGRAWIAMREDEPVARAMGINTWQYKLMAFAMGAAFAGLGGGLFASRNEFTGPDDHNLLVSINVLAVVIVGGMGSIPGVIIGALVLKGLPELLRDIDTYRLLVFGALLVVMMIYRPEGLWPSARRRIELHPEPKAGDT